MKTNTRVASTHSRFNDKHHRSRRFDPCGVITAKMFFLGSIKKTLLLVFIVPEKKSASRVCVVSTSTKPLFLTHVRNLYTQ